MKQRIAACSCGQLSISVEGEPLGTGVCHCLACQRRTGSVFATLAAFPKPWNVTGNATAYVRSGDQGGTFTFHFCPQCGSTVFHTEHGVEECVMVAVGAFADPGFPPPQDSVYDCRRHRWVTLPANLIVFDKDTQ